MKLNFLRPLVSGLILILILFISSPSPSAPPTPQTPNSPRLNCANLGALFCLGCQVPLEPTAKSCPDCGRVVKEDPTATLAAPSTQRTCPNSRCGIGNEPTARSCIRCGEVIPMVAGTLVGGRFRITDVIKTGGFGAVYRAEDTQNGNRVVAIKDMIDGALDESAIRLNLFRREAATLERLSATPFIPRFIHFSESEGGARLAMEFIEGRDLDDVLTANSRRPFPTQLVATWGMNIADLLILMHGMPPPIIHRDIKPENLLLLPDNRTIRMIDFGTAVALGTNEPGNRSSGGRTQIFSQFYASPEQILGRSEPRSDLYSLASTLFELATGRNPENEIFSQGLVQAYLNQHQAALTREQITFFGLLSRNLSPDVNQRQRSAQEFRNSLAALFPSASGTQPTVRPATPPRPAPPTPAADPATIMATLTPATANLPAWVPTHLQLVRRTINGAEVERYEAPAGSPAIHIQLLPGGELAFLSRGRPGADGKIEAMPGTGVIFNIRRTAIATTPSAPPKSVAPELPRAPLPLSPVLQPPTLPPRPAPFSSFNAEGAFYLSEVSGEPLFETSARLTVGAEIWPGHQERLLFIDLPGKNQLRINIVMEGTQETFSENDRRVRFTWGSEDNILVNSIRGEFLTDSQLRIHLDLTMPNGEKSRSQFTITRKRTEIIRQAPAAVPAVPLRPRPVAAPFSSLQPGDYALEPVSGPNLFNHSGKVRVEVKFSRCEYHQVPEVRVRILDEILYYSILRLSVKFHLAPEFEKFDSVEHSKKGKVVTRRHHIQITDQNFESDAEIESWNGEFLTGSQIRFELNLRMPNGVRETSHFLVSRVDPTAQQHVPALVPAATNAPMSSTPSLPSAAAPLALSSAVVGSLATFRANVNVPGYPADISGRVTNQNGNLVYQWEFPRNNRQLYHVETLSPREILVRPGYRETENGPLLPDPDYPGIRYSLQE